MAEVTTVMSAVMFMVDRPTVLDSAKTDKLTISAALEVLLALGVDADAARRLAGRTRFACLPTPATLNDFDFDAAPGVVKALIDDLATRRYLELAPNVMLIGPPEVGKTIIAVDLDRTAVQAGYRSYFTTARRPRRPLPTRCHRGALGHHHAVLRRTTTAGHR